MKVGSRNMVIMAAIYMDVCLHLAGLILGDSLDILAISCDSFHEATNFTIGRRQGNKSHLNSLMPIVGWCKTYKVAFKINTVVNTHNWEEDMSHEILELCPVRWKVILSVCKNTKSI